MGQHIDLELLYHIEEKIVEMQENNLNRIRYLRNLPSEIHKQINMIEEKTDLFR